MAVFMQSLISGILIGGLYALIGIGLTLIFGVMRVINFAHGDILMVGDGTSPTSSSRCWASHPFVSVLITFPLMFLFGGFLQKVFINRVLNALAQNQILLTIGLGLIMSNTVMLIFTFRLQDPHHILFLLQDLCSGRRGGVLVSTPRRSLSSLLPRPSPRRCTGPAEDRHGAGHPRHGPGPGCGPAHGHQREAHVHHRVWTRLCPGRHRGRTDLADLRHLPPGGWGLHAEGLRHHRTGRHGAAWWAPLSVDPPSVSQNP